MSPAAVLDRVTGGRGLLAIKYSATSLVGVTITQSLLLVFVGLLDLDPTWSNVAAVSLTVPPAFLLSKRWVWLRDGKVSFRREILPFWIFTIAGLLLSTLLVAIAERVADSTLLIMVASVAGFGILWVAKFLFLDTVMFAEPEEEQLAVEAA